jgi:tetratricopeptide (TPR) repeat protein
MFIFISHSSKDDGIVREIRQALEALGIETWADSERLSGGDPLTSKIQNAIRKADHFLCVVSLNALNSEWVQREVQCARSVRKRRYKIIPLTLPGVGIPAMRLLIGEDAVAIRLGDGAAAVTDALPQILAAIGLQRPTETVPHAPAQGAPVADLVLELRDPAVEELDGKRRATAVATLTYWPADGSPKVESQRYRFTAPLGPIEAEEIAWYLERYVNWPAGLFQERAQRVVEALPKWGKLLYDTVYGDAAREALEAWKASGAGERRFTVKVDKELIAGTADDMQKEAAEAAMLLLSLPWELIHDGQGYLFQGKHVVRVRRSLPNRNRQEALVTQPPIRVLLVSPRPEDESAGYIDHRVSARPLVEALSQLGGLAEFHLLEPPTFPALEAELLRETYHVVHFDGHGVYDDKHGLGMLCFEDPADVEKLEGRRSELIDAEKIAGIVRQQRIPLFFLEACQTAKADTDPSASVAGKLLESGVASVAAMSHSVLVETARRFITEFYKELLSGKRVGQAMLAGQRALKSDTFRGKSFTGELHLEDWFVPVLFQEEQDPQLVHELPAQEVKAVIQKQKELELGDLPAEPAHQFLGRSRDLLKGDRILARKRYLVVLGSGGEGKTTFAAELARWLVATRRFQRAAFTCVEHFTEARQVLFSIGAQLVPNFAAQAGTDDELGCQLLERALAERATLLVIDNMESMLAAGGEALDEILELCDRLGKAGETRVIFTSREALPAPFAENVLRIGRLDRDSTIRLVGNLLPGAPESGASQEDLEKLVDAVGCHARALVLIAREVGAFGVRHATEHLHEVTRAIEAKHPGDRENSLLASAELSLRRLPAEIRQLIRPLSVFHGGGGLPAIGLAMKLKPDQVRAVAGALIGVGLAEYVAPGYLRFDPAMIGNIAPEERETATVAWAEAMEAEVGFLYEQLTKDANLANNLALLELPNFLAALEHLSRSKSAERAVEVATMLESLISRSNRPRVLARVVEIRTAAAQRLGGWSHSRFEAERASIERLMEQGRLGEAVRAAQALRSKAEAAGEAAYEGAPYDGAGAQMTLGRALQVSGGAEAALPQLEEARQRFERLKEPRMAGASLALSADCLAEIGRHDEAAEAYERAIRSAEELLDPRSVATGKTNLATLWLRQRGNYPEALRLYGEAVEVFERLKEPAAVAAVWHQIGMVCQLAGEYEAAEQAYQKSFNIDVQTGNRSGQASSLGELGNLYSEMGRLEDSIRLYCQAAEIYVANGDLRNEGLARNNLANELIKLRRFDEARLEIERAIACKRRFGHGAEPWKIFSTLCDLERAVGNEPAALAARDQAIAAYRAYRSDGGASEIDTGKLVAEVKQNPAGARAALDDPNLPYRMVVEIMLALENLKS